MDKIIKVKVWVSTQYVNSGDEVILEFDEEEYNEMSCDEKEEMFREAMFGMIEWDYSEI